MTRQEAKAAGLTRYFTGEPCKYGHLSERFVSTSSCCQCGFERQQTPEAKEWQTAYENDSREKRAAYRRTNREKITARYAAYYKANSEKISAKSAAYRQQHREKIAAREAAYRQQHREKIAAKKAAYQKANPHIPNAITAKRRAAKLQATPPWADLEAIKAIYEHAAFITKVTGEVNHVDHIIPLLGKTVCGLHVHTNLQILTASDNIKKGNKVLPTYETLETRIYYEQLSDFAEPTKD